MDPNQDTRFLVSVYAQHTHKRLEMPDCGENNPYHLFFYMLPRLKFIDHGALVEYYYPKFQNTYIGEAALAALPSRFQREIKKQEGIEYIELPPVMCGVDCIIDPWAYQYVRDLYIDHWKDTIQQKKKYTYISRKKTQFQSRMVLNEDEYLKEIRDMGFSIYCMEDLTFLEQIRLFRSSEIITGPHGAALSFSIFCEPGTIVCEIMRDVPNKGHFSDIARKCGLTFFRYTGITEYEEEHNNMKIHKDSYIASLKEMISLKLREK
jgi:capsular polysaccharide biosynthesis protein